MPILTIVNPVAIPKSETREALRYPTPPRLDSLQGKTIGIFWNGKNNGQYALARTKQQLAERFPTVRFVDYLGDTGKQLLRASDAQLDAMVAECDAVIGASAD